MNKKTTVELSTWSIAKIILFILGIFFLYNIRSVVALIFVVIILVAGFTPFVNWLVSKKIPRVLSVVMLYLLIFGFISFFIYLVIPPLIEQITLISNNLNVYSEKIQNLNFNISQFIFQGRDLLSFISNSLSQISGGIVNTVISISGSAASVLTVLVLTFYILVEQDSIEKFILTFMPKIQRHHAIAIYKKVDNKLGKWLQGQLLLAIIIGISSYIILSLLGIKYALLLAVLAGVLEVVPIVGPIVAGVTAIAMAYFTGALWWQIIAIAVSYVVVQQVESQFLVPKMMGKAVGLSPIIIIIALMVGAKVAGILGAALSIPIAAGISVVIQEWPNLKKIK